jgi:hypothetical protein
MSTNKKFPIKITDVELQICYKDALNQHIELSQISTFNRNEEFKINLSDYGDNTNPVILTFNSIEHLEAILTDFKNKFKLVSK